MSWLLLSLLCMNIGPVSPKGPNRQPQLAARGTMAAVAFTVDNAIYFALSQDTGRTFSTPAKAVDVKVMSGRHRGPRVAILPDAIVITAVAAGPPSEGDVVTWRSVDGGKTWSRAGVVNDQPRAAREGLHAMAADRDGNLFAAWLDLRSEGTKLYGSRSTDGGRTWSKNVLIYSSPDGTICQCCDPSLAVDDHGKIWAMWRNVLDGSRDLYVSSSADGARFSDAEKLGSGTWKLNACPMDGGGLVVDRGHVVSAWRRDSQVFVAEAGKAETVAGTGKDVAIAAGKKGVYVAWSNGSAIELLTPGASTPVRLAADGVFVNLAALSDGSVLAAWESQGAIETRRIE